jgi:hypothetical protein
MYKKLLELFIKQFGRNPNKLERLQLQFKAFQESGKGQILRPDFNKKKPWHITEKKADVTKLDDPLVNEFARTETFASPTRIKQGFSTRSKLNHWSQNQKQVSDFIGRKNREFNSLGKDDQKEVLEMFETQIKKHMPKERKAGGGVAGLLGERTGFKRGTKKSKKKEFRFFYPPWMGPSIHQREESHQVPDRVNARGHGVNFPYKSLEDIPPDVLTMLMKDPVFDLETFLKKVAWSDPDKTRIQKRIKGEKEPPWGAADHYGDMLLYKQKFGKGESIADGLLTMKSPSDANKVQTILHEMRHAKMREPWFMKSSAIPKYVRETGDPHYSFQKYGDKDDDPNKFVGGEELYIRYLDQLFGDVSEKGDIAGSDYKPYFDKILRDKWAPHAKAYKEILKEEKRVKSKPYGLAGGGIAGMLGEPTYQDDNHRVPYDSGNMVLPKEKPFQGLFHTEVGGPVITKDDSEFEAVVDRWSQFARQQGEGPEDRNKFKSFALENIVKIGREQGYEDDEIKEIILRINKADGGRVPLAGGKTPSDVTQGQLLPRDFDDLSEEEKIHLMKLILAGEIPNLAEGGRVPLGKGKSALQGLAKLMDEFFPGTTKIGQTSKPLAKKTQLKQALAGFKKREKAAKISETIKADEKTLAKLTKEHNKKYGPSREGGDEPMSDALYKQMVEDHKKTVAIENKILENRIKINDPPTKDDYKYYSEQLDVADADYYPVKGNETLAELEAMVKKTDADDIAEQKYWQKVFEKDDKKQMEKYGVLVNRVTEKNKLYKEFPNITDHQVADILRTDLDGTIDPRKIKAAKETLRKQTGSPWYTDPKTLTPEEELRKEFPGIDDNLIKNILADTNPQRIAEVKATLHEALKMQQKGMGHEEIINIFKKKPTKHASGGLAGMLGE